MDNGIIIFSAIVLFSVILAIVFWPSSKNSQLLSYLPNNTSFYVHFSDFKNQWSDDENIKYPFIQESLLERFVVLQSILGSNYLNLEEVVLFQLDGQITNDNYLLKFSRLPKSFISDSQNISKDYDFYSLDKNVLVIAYQNFDYKDDYQKIEPLFDRGGVNVYYQKQKQAKWLDDLAKWLNPVYKKDEVHINFYQDNSHYTKISLLQDEQEPARPANSFIAPSKFDLALGLFNNSLQEQLPIKEIIKSLPYSNISEDFLNNRLLSDSLFFSRGDSWLLASYNDWANDWAYLLKNVKLEEINKTLADGTAYRELVASADQAPQQQEINGQEVWQIDSLWSWAIGDKYYLSNDKDMIADITSHNVYLESFFAKCIDKQASLGDFVYINQANSDNVALRQFLIDNNWEEISLVSYTSSTYSGLGICF